MKPIVYSAPIVDVTKQFGRCEMTPGTSLALKATVDDRVAVLAWRRSWWLPRSSRAVLVGFLDATNSQRIKLYLDQTERLRVRVVSADGFAKKPEKVAISIWAEAIPQKPPHKTSRLVTAANPATEV
jgi:hypothetical protein